MKKNLNILPLFLGITLLAGILIISCKEDEKPNGGVPIIDYIRLTDTAAADSFITSAYMGQLIAIVGRNLSGAREIMFNDQPGFLIPTYVTDVSILVNVPSTVPTSINNKMIITFEDGYELQYDFYVDVPPPVITSIKCEYVPDGDIAVLYGDYFFEPITVLWPGDVEVEIVSMEKTKIEVTVPEGATPGQIKIQTLFGEALSPFLFRDNRNTIVDFDLLLHESWTAAVAYADSAPEIAPTSGNYAIIQSDDVTDWDWENNLAVFAWGENVRGDVPLATGFVPALDFRFEVNVVEPWYDVRMEIYFSPYGQGHGRDAVDPSFCRWKPWLEEPYTTDGWITVSIPLSQFWFDRDDAASAVNGSQPLQNLTGLTNLNMMIFGPRESDASATHPIQVCVDNIRIVPHDIE